MGKSNTHWKIHADGTYLADAITADWPTLTIGGRTTFRLWFSGGNGDLVVSNGETHTVDSGDVEVYDTVTVESGGTLNVNGELYTGTAEERWADVEPFVRYAGHAASGRGLNNVPWFVEQLASDARVGSIVMGFEPATKIQNREKQGVWGLLVSGRDRTNSALSNYQIELDVLVLDRFGEYASRAAVKSDLEA